MESKLYRESTMYRPLFVTVDNKEYELGDIIVYGNNGEMIAEVGRGYFDRDNELTIQGEIVKRLKVNTSRKENFIVKIIDSNYYSGGESRYCIYIYQDNVDFKDLGLYKKWESVYHKYSINGNEFDTYVKSLDKRKEELNNEAKELVKKLADNFGYARNGMGESELMEVFSKLQTLNREILEEKKKIDEYEVE
jgi:hypothetical protein